MAEGIGWKTTELQIETLIPGVLLVCGIDAALHQYDIPTTIRLLSWHETFARGALFVAIAYAAGAFGGIFCRIFIDRLSESCVRSWVFTCSSHTDQRKLMRNRLLVDKDRFLTDYKFERKTRKRSQSSSFGNAAYRSVIRTTSRKEEVDRRRSQGRILRNLALPAAVWTVIIFVTFSSLAAAYKNAIGAFLGLFVFFFWVFPYAYAEYVNFAEAYDITKK